MGDEKIMPVYFLMLMFWENVDLALNRQKRFSHLALNFNAGSAHGYTGFLSGFVNRK